MIENIYVDATKSPIGRIAAFAAKKALQGNKVFIVNSESAIISGNKMDTIEKFKQRRARGGTAQKGPYPSKDTEKMLKRAIRGMIPDHRLGRGKEAWRRIKCYNSIPEEYKDQKLITVPGRTPAKYITLKELKQKL